MVIETQCGQRIDHPVVADEAAESGFHCHDAENVLGRNAVLLAGALQGGLVCAPERYAAINMPGIQKLGTVAGPAAFTRFAFQTLVGFGQIIQRPLLALGLREQTVQIFPIETVLLHHLLDKLRQRRIAGVIAADRAGAVAADAGKRSQVGSDMGGLAGRIGFDRCRGPRLVTRRLGGAADQCRGQRRGSGKFEYRANRD